LRLPSARSRTRPSDDPARLSPPVDGGDGGVRTASSTAQNGEGGVPRRKGAAAIDLLVVLALCLLFVFGIVRPFLAASFFIPSESMSPTLNPGDRVLAAKSAYLLDEPARGDLAVFDDGSGAVIKRVVGLAGDAVSVEDGVLVVNREPTREPYVDYGLSDSSFFGPVTVPEGHVFVMGDNRSNSRDSRTIGPVSEEDLIGRAVLRFWPLDRAEAL
jgi:signal peptidase I